jgi:hypothetical protein
MRNSITAINEEIRKEVTLEIGIYPDGCVVHIYNDSFLNPIEKLMKKIGYEVPTKVDKLMKKIGYDQ